LLRFDSQGIILEARPASFECLLQSRELRFDVLALSIDIWDVETAARAAG